MENARSSTFTNIAWGYDGVIGLSLLAVIYVPTLFSVDNPSKTNIPHQNLGRSETSRIEPRRANKKHPAFERGVFYA